MIIPDVFKYRRFYHFTHIDNIDSIVEHGLLSTNEKLRRGIEHIDLANWSIQQRRSVMKMPCAPYDTIHDYVPFYFASTNPMLLSVLNKKNIDQQLVVFIVVSIEKILDDNVIFTDASANTKAPPRFFSDPRDLDKLKWDLIDLTTWGSRSDDERHSRMAEVLVHKTVPLDWIEAYIVFDRISKDKIKDVYTRRGLKAPVISYSPYRRRHFFFLKFFEKGRKKESLITGPRVLNNHFSNAIKTITRNRRNMDSSFEPAFEDVHDALIKIKQNFCVIPELEGIFGLQTDNEVHRESVSDHTIQVVSNLKQFKYYTALSKPDRRVVKLSAYLHDIGKGPKSKWDNGIQKCYPDHPADAVPMLVRVLTDEFVSISEDDIRKICLLVFYHDIVGDIIENGRSMSELIKLNIDENELDMLIALSLADTSAISRAWVQRIELKLDDFVDEAMKEIM